MANNQTPEKQSAFKELVLPVIVLVVICLVCSALLAVLNDVTAPIIDANTKAETLAAYLSVLPEGTTDADLTEVADITHPRRGGRCHYQRGCRGGQGGCLRLFRQGCHRLCGL